MQVLFFYNATEGSGMIGEVRNRDFLEHYTYAGDSFGRGWTSVADIPSTNGKLLFYNSNNRSGLVGKPNESAFSPEQTFGEGAFGLWTHISVIRRDQVRKSLFYNSNDGAAAIGFNPSTEIYGPGRFATGWSHILPSLTSDRMFLYNNETGAAAAGFDPSVEVFPEGGLQPNWSHIAMAPGTNGDDMVLFYRASDRSGAYGRLGETGRTGTSFRTTRVYNPGDFGLWTHVVAIDQGFFFYNSDDGTGALAECEDNGILTVQIWGPHTFRTGWTNIQVSSSARRVGILEGYAWPLSVKPGQTIGIRTSSDADSVKVTYVGFRNRPALEVDANVINQSKEVLDSPIAPPQTGPVTIQPESNSPSIGASAWTTTFSFQIPDGTPSGIYAAKLEDSEGDMFYAPFVVQPKDGQRSEFAVIVNVSTWNAYNEWGGFSRYSTPAPDPWPGPDRWVFSYQRPLRDVFNPSRTDAAYHYSSKHQTRGELWALNWLRENGVVFDAYSDVDIHVGVPNLKNYKAIIFTTHPEYVSQGLMNAVQEYLDAGGSLIYLGGNGLFDCVDISPDLTTLTVFGTPGVGRSHLFRRAPINEPESSVLGVAFPWTVNGGDIGNNAGERVGYRVVNSEHPFFFGTGVADGAIFGTQGWCITEGAGTLAAGGASGWECDRQDGNSPPNRILLAQGLNSGPAAEMVTYDHAGGGFVFSAGSMTIQGSMPVDAVIQRIIANVLARARSELRMNA